VTSSVRPAGPEGFRFRRLAKPEEFRAVEEVQRAAWGLDANAPTISTALQRAIQDNGGFVLGAFTDIYLAGFSMGFLGWDGSTLYHQAFETAVRPEYQNHRVGFQLHSLQREEVLAQGLAEVRGLFDPLSSKSAMLFVRRLGGTPDRYYSHYFGQLTDAVNQGLETDRVRWVWELSSPRVISRLANPLQDAEKDRTYWRSAQPIVETEPGESGIRVPTAVQEPDRGTAHLEIPFDIALVRTHEPGALRRWRHATRDAFRAAFDLRYQVEDFAVISSEHERRSFYFLRAPSPEQSESTAPPKR
jgi:predicted GNAT superfamily acetyltransferase